MVTNKRQRSLTTKTKEKTWISKISMTNKVISCILIYGTAVKVNCSALVQEYGECRHVSSEHRNANEKQDLHNTSVNANTLSTQEQKTGGAEEAQTQQLCNDSQMLCNIIYKYVSNEKGVTAQEILEWIEKIAESQKQAIINTKVLENIADALWNNLLYSDNKDIENRGNIAQGLIGILNDNKDKINTKVLENIDCVLLVLLSSGNKDIADKKEIAQKLIGIIKDTLTLLDKKARTYLYLTIIGLYTQYLSNDDIRKSIQDIILLFNKTSERLFDLDGFSLSTLQRAINNITINIANNKYSSAQQKEIQNIIKSIQEIITAGKEQIKQKTTRRI